MANVLIVYKVNNNNNKQNTKCICIKILYVNREVKTKFQFKLTEQCAIVYIYKIEK